MKVDLPLLCDYFQIIQHIVYPVEPFWAHRYKPMEPDNTRYELNKIK